MSEATTGVKWENYSDSIAEGIVYRGDGFFVRVRSENWWVKNGIKIVIDHFAPDFATAKAQAESWILEREGRLPATATDGGWIACKDAMPPAESPILEIIAEARYLTGNQWRTTGVITHWRLKRTDPHADASCLFSDRYRPTVEQARVAARHVAGCAECRERLEAKGGA